MKCKNCGGELRFDISKQMLICDFCSSEFEPDEKKSNEADDTNQESVKIKSKAGKELSVKIFTCPQCGGEMFATDLEATQFCSFCGSMSLLDSRIGGLKAPELIIPFKIDKEGCKNAFKKYVEKVPFTPQAFKDPKFIDRFRPIYTPYWVYDIMIKGNGVIKGEKEYRKGNYDITEFYDVTFNVESNYDGISYDASSSFNDDISAEIAPFNAREIYNFNPSYLSGFYADISDVSRFVYIKDAINVGNENIKTKLDASIPKDGLILKTSFKSFPKASVTPRTAMFPVWFLSYNNNGRVAYAVVNGANGKVSCDLPVSIPKFLIFSAALAMGLFFLINGILTLMPKYLLFASAVISFIVFCLYESTLSSIDDKDNRVNDKGYQFVLKKLKIKNKGTGKNKKTKLQPETEPEIQSFEENYNGEINDSETDDVTALEEEKAPEAKDKTKKTEDKPKKKDPLKGCLIALAVLLGCIDAFIMICAFFAELGFLGWISAILTGVTVIFVVASDVKSADKLIEFMFILMQVIAFLMNFVSVVYDIYYYIAVIANFVLIVISLIYILKKYNVLVTRPLPQFNARGNE